MWGFIALIIIVAIAFGITLHEAFWGIIAFCVGLGIFLLISALFGYGIFAGAALIKKYNTPQAKAARKIKRKQAIADSVSGAGILLWVFSPLLSAVLAVLVATTIGKDPNNAELAKILGCIAFIIPLLFFFGGLVWFIRYARNLANKKPRK
jgi:hypothetical protein